MADLALGVSVTRALLGLADLNINDHTNYYVSSSFLGGQVTWSRIEVSSPFIDGALTAFRTRSKVMEPMGIEVRGDTSVQLAQNVDVLLKAFQQDYFDLHVQIGAQAYSYRCEAADYQMTWTGPRMVANQVQLMFNVPRSPVPTQGPI